MATLIFLQLFSLLFKDKKPMGYHRLILKLRGGGGILTVKYSNTIKVWR